jgi:hypothetical protein
MAPLGSAPTMAAAEEAEADDTPWRLRGVKRRMALRENA